MGVANAECYIPECSTWHKFPNPEVAISNKKCSISNQGGTILTKNVLFPTQGQNFNQIYPIYNPGGRILTKNVKKIYKYIYILK